jgi:hypothetical protein
LGRMRCCCCCWSPAKDGSAGTGGVSRIVDIPVDIGRGMGHAPDWKRRANWKSRRPRARSSTRTETSNVVRVSFGGSSSEICGHGITKIPSSSFSARFSSLPRCPYTK